jgi:hypothetical protein
VWCNDNDSTLALPQNMSNTTRVVQGSRFRFRFRFRFLPICDASVKKDGKAIEILDQPLPYPRLLSISYLGSYRNFPPSKVSALVCLLFTVQSLDLEDF